MDTSVPYNLFKVKINSVKMMQHRGYQIPEEEFCTTESVMDVSNFYLEKKHIPVHPNQIRIYHDPLNCTGKQLIIPAGQELDDEEGYVNFHQFICQSLNLDKRNDLRNSMSNLYYHPVNKEYLLVYFTNSGLEKGKKLASNEFKAIIFIMESICINNLLIISENDATPTVNASINDVRYIPEHRLTVTEKIRNIQFIQDKFFYICLLEHAYVPRYELSSVQKFKDLTNGTQKISSGHHITLDDPVAIFLGLHLGDVIIEHSNMSCITSLVNNEIIFRNVIPAVKDKKQKKK